MLTSILLSALSTTEDRLDAAWYQVRKKMRWVKPSVIMPYQGYGNKETVKILGRVLEDKRLEKPSPDDPLWRNIRAMLRRFLSYEVPFARLKATFQGNSQLICSDAEGYFQATFSVNADLLAPLQRWYPVELELLSKKNNGRNPVKAIGEVMIPDLKSDFGVISDIDDTVLVSDTTQVRRMLRLAFLENAATRLPFHGVAAFYRALQKGKEGDSHNPFFYVSSSPWNLYDVLADFFRLNNIPKGPVLLRDLGISSTQFIKEKHTVHKLQKIRQIINAYEDLQFILVGDSGQHDPEIYQQVIEEYPGRVLAVYIRDISLNARSIEIKTIAERMTGSGVQMVLCKDTEEASRHALAHGFIDGKEMEPIHQEKEKDEKEENVLL